jgi:lysophospholipase L1-like esterase
VHPNADGMKAMGQAVLHTLGAGVPAQA